jgi:hypothetical protein
LLTHLAQRELLAVAQQQKEFASVPGLKRKWLARCITLKPARLTSVSLRAVNCSSR